MTGTLARAENYDDLLRTYHLLGWVGAGAVVAVVVVLLSREHISPRGFDLLRILSATVLIVVTARAAGALFSQVTVLTAADDQRHRALRLALLVLGLGLGSFVARYVVAQDPMDRADEPVEAADTTAPSATTTADDEIFEVPPLVEIPALTARGRMTLPFIAAAAAIAATALIAGVTSTGGGFGVLEIDGYVGTVAFVLAGSLLGVALLLPALVREDEIPLGIAAAGLGVVALGVGLHGHLAQHLSEWPGSALLIGFSSAALVPLTLLSLGELRDVVDPDAVWLGALVALTVLSGAAATSYYAMERANPEIFFSDMVREQCPPTCPPDPLPMPGRSDRPAPSVPRFPAGFPSGFPTELLPSDFPSYLFFSPSSSR